MRRICLVFLLLLTACQGLAPLPTRTPEFTPTVPPPTATPTLAPLPAGTPEPTATANPDFRAIYHPDGPLYVGDQVSLEVLAPTAFDAQGQTVRISLGEKTLSEQGFGPFGIGARQQATFYWAWDTRGLSAGDYTLTFSVLTGGPTWDETVTIRPAAEVPLPEPDARWELVETACCVIHYISDTDSARDLEKLKEVVQTQAEDVERRLDTKIDDKISITFLPRVLGHGGFTSQSISVSYLDQNYAGSTTAQVIHHEMVHWLDTQMGGDLRPTILVEGLAVFMSDGHFKIEPILPRAAALLDLNWYIPLRELANSFYPSQHEIGYIEGSALIAYLVNTYGWDKFNTFYRAIHPASSGLQADALDAAFQTHFDLTFDQVEQAFIVFLRQQPVDDITRTDLRLTVTFYDTVRRYQRMLDPSAYFLTAWLVDENTMRERSIVADYLRHPRADINRQVETLLISADASLRAGDYAAVETALRAANSLLDAANQ